MNETEKLRVELMRTALDGQIYAWHKYILAQAILLCAKRHAEKEIERQGTGSRFSTTETKGIK